MAPKTKCPQLVFLVFHVGSRREEVIYTRLFVFNLYLLRKDPLRYNSLSKDVLVSKKAVTKSSKHTQKEQNNSNND